MILLFYALIMVNRQDPRYYILQIWLFLRFSKQSHFYVVARPYFQSRSIINDKQK